MSILSWIILGFLAGALASHFSGTEHGCVTNIILGVIGAFVGGAIFTWFGGTKVTGCNIYSIIVAMVGALVVLAIARAFSGRSRY